MPSQTISIVDDDAEVRSATASLLRSIGLDVCTFASAEDFLASTELHETACLIADVHMPGMSGLELQGRLLPMARRFPVILMTAHPTDGARAEAIAKGAAGFFAKPFDADALLACVEDNMTK
ncbi:response regulator receiver protein [Methylocella silvestris BL2]|uniref:Response regulator receiver protein n=1 Tax=Methylocella silvestris (strain DSM 15510 / CIP 108128 / LMG 27833 / NCIMB 13906 / BL2) TaxID=395965 RepID=B8ERQ5_METSB|nr:response regulator [Methylocella silvestris]ACK51603.1 response regulator receiver protein [Methylocella silvestris BL2]